MVDIGQDHQVSSYISGIGSSACLLIQYIMGWRIVVVQINLQLMCNYYTVRQDGSTTFMRSWALQVLLMLASLAECLNGARLNLWNWWNCQGSMDGQNWMSLRVHDDDPTICHPGQFATWPIVGPASLLPFRFFRVALTGPAAGCTWNLCICFLELYGYFR